ncbi:hypothetical protein [Acidithrix sp. C25]|uniref:hypothetical protein n=1 Tax=Acidithrix sp. C25 TaxID=1671482 RepID=UPI00191B96BE|nr:hypothetical protein [Acidithrix sp. C25]
MFIINHLARKVAVLAVTGGTAFALFGGAPAHTQFSANSAQTATFTGGTVGEAVTNGSFSCSGLIPPSNRTTYSGNPCTETITLKNTGNTRESFDVTIGTPTGTTSATNNLDQLMVTYPDPTSANSANTVTESYKSLLSGNTGNNVLHIATLPASSTGSTANSLSVTLKFSLAAETGSTAIQNAWYGATVHIPYTVTATPSA